ncbi:phytanoyl-CoA dioxygenase family protein [Halomonas organivorans]
MFDHMSKTEYDERMEERGWVIFEEVIAEDTVRDMREDCLAWVDICKAYQIKNGINDSGDGTAHQTVGRNDSLDKFYDMNLFHEYIARYFDEKPYILCCSTPTAGYASKRNYLQKIHRDTRTYIQDYKIRLNMIVMLDDFTVERGATEILSGSHHREEKPNEEYFSENCEPIIGKAGSVVLFNSYLWHRGGRNITENTRVALTIGYTRPFIKPQVDYARMLGEEYGKKISPLTRQVMGYNSRVPVSLDEWYRPVEDRLYHADQG